MGNELSLSYEFARAFRTHRVRFWLMENKCEAQEYAIKALVVNWSKREESRNEFSSSTRLR